VHSDLEESLKETSRSL
jgi:hypothetical protein